MQYFIGGRVMKGFLFKMGKGLGILLLIIIAIIITAAALRLIVRHNIYIHREIKSQNGIDEELAIEIGGINQAIHIRGTDINNPVILVLHGGPGSPMTALQYKYQDEWEKNFTVVNWDQRNTGKTYFLNNTEEITATVSMDQALKDTLDMVMYLRESLHKDKIIILGHSYGSILGTLFVQSYPEYVSAYIGAGQQISFDENKKVQYEQLLKRISEKDMKKLQSTKLNKAAITYSELVNKYLNYAVNGNTTLYAMLSPYYTLDETKCYTLDTNVTQKGIMDYLGSKGFDASKLGTTYKIPVFYILGDHDYIVPYTIARNFFENINAPYKDVVVIENAGHMIMLDQPEAFAKFLNESVLPYVKQ